MKQTREYNISDRVSQDNLCIYLLTYLLNKGPASVSASKDYELYVDLAQLLDISNEYLTTLYSVNGSTPVSVWFEDCREALLKLKRQKLVKKYTVKRGRVLKYTKWCLTDTGKTVAETI